VTHTPPSANVVWRLGTMGYAYDDWRRVFFPPHLPRDRWLGYYARCFDTLELNTTFHAFPTAERLRSWAAAVPETFRFSVKAPRLITHESGIDEAVSALHAFCGVVLSLGRKLGGVLLQFPPTFEASRLVDLERLIAAVPADCPLFVELRHASWQTPVTQALLHEHGVAWVIVDHLDHPWLVTVPVTATTVYVRLVGKHGRFDREDREQFDPTAELQQWKDRLLASLTPEAREVWVLFNNDYAGHAPATLRRFARMMGCQLPEPPLRQQSLFADGDWS
jgi:uncharacterized protein YecE (DUF72 family)